MARTPKPWWRKDRKSWFVTFAGRRFNLGRDRDKAFKLFHELMARAAREERVRSASLMSLLHQFLDWTRRNRAERTYDWYSERLQWFTAPAEQPVSIGK